MHDIRTRLSLYTTSQQREDISATIIYLRSIFQQRYNFFVFFPFIKCTQRYMLRFTHIPSR